MTHAPQFTTARLLLWMLYFATFATFFSLLPATSLSFSVATCSAVVFAVVDIQSNKHFRGWLGITYFACALAYVVAIGFVTLLLFPPTLPPKPPLPFWAGLYHLVSGDFVRDIAQEIVAAIVLISHYIMTVIVCTLVSTGVALVFVRRQRKARWLLLMNTPGILLSIYVVTAVVYDGLIAA